MHTFRVCRQSLLFAAAVLLAGCAGRMGSGPMVIDASGRPIPPGGYPANQDYSRVGRYGGTGAVQGQTARPVEYGAVGHTAGAQPYPDEHRGAGASAHYAGQYGQNGGYDSAYGHGQSLSSGHIPPNQGQGGQPVTVYYRRDPQHPLANADGYVAEYVAADQSAAYPNVTAVPPAGNVKAPMVQVQGYSQTGRYGMDSTAVGPSQQQIAARSPAAPGGVTRPVVADVSLSQVGTPTSPTLAQVLGKVTHGSAERDTGYSDQARPVAMDRSGDLMSNAGAVTNSTVSATGVQAGGQEVAAMASGAVPAVNVLEVQPAGVLELQAPEVRDLTEPAVSHLPSEYPRQGQTVLGMGELIDRLEQLVAERPGDVAGQVALRCLYAANGRNDAAFVELPNVPDSQQSESVSLARAVLLAARAGSDRSRNDSDAANEALEVLDGLRGQIAQRADLVISKLELCSKVDGFGRYELIGAGELSSGEARNLIVYCELDNFSNKLNADGRYVTRLSSEITLYDENFRIVTQRQDDVTDLPCHNQRRDFFLRGPMPVPRLSPGKYQLEMVIKDRVAGKIAQPKRVSFEVIADDTRAR